VDGGIPYGDIIVIGAIAAFIILRYRAMLGEKQGRDVENAAPPKPATEYDRIIQIPTRERPKPAEAKTPAKDYGPLKDQFSAMKAIDRDFTPEEFLEGARGAFEMVIEAYNKRDHDTLKMLLAPAMYDNFKRVIEADEAAGRTSATTLLAIAKSEIVDAKLRGNNATIAVTFVTEQVPLVRDASGNIIEGDASIQEVIDDHWVFERDLSSSAPDWKIIET
jgi:predicted lipid-binding transport protein (Tim44 family)